MRILALDTTGRIASAALWQEDRLVDYGEKDSQMNHSRTLLPVVQQIALLMNQGAGMAPYVFYFGLLTGATLGGNLTPIGASANITAIGILRKNGETVRTRDFLRIGVPFTLSAVLCGYVYIWLVWGIA